MVALHRTSPPEEASVTASRTQLVPTVVEPSEGGERAFDIYSRLLRDRVVFLGSAIDDAVGNLIVAQLLYLDAEHPGRDVSLYVNSPGGATTDLFAIYDTMQHLASDVATYCVGQAASAAAVLVAAGTRGKRFALPNARVLLHQPHGGMEGQASDLAIHAKEAARQRRRLEEIVAEHTGQPPERVRADLDRDFILTAEEARSYGIVDAVVTHAQLTAVRRAEALPDFSPPPRSRRTVRS
jgi:ATP-dependent Clp protease, protease subunit